MAHPHNHLRSHKVEHSRVSHLTKHYAKGGMAKHSDEAEDRKLIKSLVKKASLKAEGGKAKHRMDRPHRAKGGRVKKGNAKTIVNVIAGGHPASGAVPPGPPMGPPPMGVAPAAPPMPPPMAARPPMPPPGGPPGGPPMPMRAKGGRIRRADGGDVSDKNRQLGQGMLRALVPIEKKYGNGMQTAQRQQMDEIYSKVGRARGGKVHKPHGSPVFNESLRDGTQVQHNDSGKSDLGRDNYPRGKAVTFESGGRVRHFYARGGAVESSDSVAPATKLPGGSGGGEARLAKEKRAARNYARPAK